MRRRSQRALVILIVGGLLAAATALVLWGLRDSIVAFYAPSELAEKAKAGQNVRIGGLVEEGSVGRDADSALTFVVTDGKVNIPVRYHGEPPDLFREGQGVIVNGVYNPDGVFEAEQVLARHDERYVPREVEEALKKSGEWKGAE